MLLVPSLALAGTGRITWTNPTQYEDGTPIDATGDYALTGTTVEWSFCGTNDVFGTKIAEVTVAHPSTAVDITVPRAGRYCFRAYANTTFETSNASLTVWRFLTGKKPKPPSAVGAVVVN
jgi:hypothetical protein